MSESKEEILKSTGLITKFLGYRYRKNEGLLYSFDGRVPIELITSYYSGDYDRLDPSIIHKGFLERYIINESALEKVHNSSEIKGLEVMYEDMTRMPIEDFQLSGRSFKPSSLLALHSDLFCKTPYPEAGGKIREIQVFLPGSGANLCPPEDVYCKLRDLDYVVDDLKRLAIYMKESNDYSQIIEYISSCVKLKCELIKVHPFVDGNGRTIRCFINKLFEAAGIPPVYIKKDEKEEYTRAMELAINEGDYNDITCFYLYEICDSIMELDINKRVREEREEKIYEERRGKKKIKQRPQQNLHLQGQNPTSVQ